MTHAVALLTLLVVPSTSLVPQAMRAPVTRTHRPARVSRLVAVDPALYYAPHLDSSAAFAAIFSLSPVVLAFHWSTEFNEVRDRLIRAKEELHQLKIRLMCGEACLVEYEQAEAEVILSHQAVQEFSNFRVAGATQELFTKIRATASRRAPQAVMEEKAWEEAEHEE